MHDNAVTGYCAQSLLSFYGLLFITHLLLLISKELARGASGGLEDSINLDVHAISELKTKGVPPTNDLLKYDYVADDRGNYGNDSTKLNCSVYGSLKLKSYDCSYKC